MKSLERDHSRHGAASPGSAFLFCALIGITLSACSANAAPLKAALLTPAQATQGKLKSLVKEGYNSAVLLLEDSASEEENEQAAARVATSSLALYYWIEIGRNPALADAHPEWMASLQTHEEWRRHFPAFAKPATNQVVKNFPWVPVLYAETFPVHLQRVEALIEDLPHAKGIFLNDLQGAPSACGCGNSFCRWTADYGPLTTARRLPDDAAARFVAAVSKLSPHSQVIPVWTTECAEHDKQVACGGVNCFAGKCWREFSNQLQPLAQQADWIGVRLPFQDFTNGQTRTGKNGGWQSAALKSFSDVLPKHGGSAISAGRLVPVLQGWDLTARQVQTQIERAQAAGVAGYVVALTAIEQSWEPRLFTLPAQVPAGAR